MKPQLLAVAAVFFAHLVLGWVLLRSALEPHTPRASVMLPPTPLWVTLHHATVMPSTPTPSRTAGRAVRQPTPSPTPSPAPARAAPVPQAAVSVTAPVDGLVFAHQPAVFVERLATSPPAVKPGATPTTDSAAPLAATASVPGLPPRHTTLAHADHQSCTPAAHPAVLRDRGIEGAVTLRVKVDTQGQVADVHMLASSGWRLFDEAAIKQARGCRFHPAQQDGQAVDSWVEFAVQFALANG
jgi:periplasmic protein TonB